MTLSCLCALRVLRGYQEVAIASKISMVRSTEQDASPRRRYARSTSHEPRRAKLMQVRNTPGGNFAHHMTNTEQLQPPPAEPRDRWPQPPGGVVAICENAEKFTKSVENSRRRTQAWAKKLDRKSGKA